MKYVFEIKSQTFTLQSDYLFVIHYVIHFFYYRGLHVFYFCTCSRFANALTLKLMKNDQFLAFECIWDDSFMCVSSSSVPFINHIIIEWKIDAMWIKNRKHISFFANKYEIYDFFYSIWCQNNPPFGDKPIPFIHIKNVLAEVLYFSLICVDVQPNSM